MSEGKPLDGREALGADAESVDESALITARGEDVFAALSETDLERELSAWDEEFDSLVDGAKSADNAAISMDDVSDDASTLEVDLERLTMAQLARLGEVERESLFGESTAVDAEAIDEEDIVNEVPGVAEVAAAADVAAVVEVPAAIDVVAVADVRADVATALAELGAPLPLEAGDDDDDFYAELEIETEAYALSGEWSTHVITREGGATGLATAVRPEPCGTAPAPLPTPAVVPVPVAEAAQLVPSPSLADEELLPAVSRRRTTQMPPGAGAGLTYLGSKPIAPPVRRRVRDALPRLVLDDLGAVPKTLAHPACDLEEDAARLLMTYEQELSHSADPARVLLLRGEAGRLALRVGDAERAKLHFESSLLRDPNSLVALRGLRAVARVMGQWREAVAYCEAELELVSAQERAAVAMLRIYYLIVSGEQDLARVAVGEFVEEHPGDVAAALLEAELAFVDGRADELFAVLGRVSQSTVDLPLAAWARKLAACGTLDAQPARALAALSTAASSAEQGDPGAALLRIEAAALLGDHARVVEELRRLAEISAGSDPTFAAALACHAAELASRHVSTAAQQTMAAMALALAPASPFVANCAAALIGSAGAETTVTQAVYALAALDDPRHRAYVAQLALRAGIASSSDADATHVGPLSQHTEPIAPRWSTQLGSEQQAALAFWQGAPEVLGKGDAAYDALQRHRGGATDLPLGEPRSYASWLGAIAKLGAGPAASSHRQLWEAIHDEAATASWSLWWQRARAVVWLERDGQVATRERTSLTAQAAPYARMLQVAAGAADSPARPRTVLADAGGQDGFVVALRAADEALRAGDPTTTFASLARALAGRPGHPFALATLAHAAALADGTQVALPVVAEVRRHAEGFAGANAGPAFELLAEVLIEIVRDPVGALAAHEAAILAKSASHASWRGVEVAYLVAGRGGDAWLLRQEMLKEAGLGDDGTAVLLDTIAMGERDNKPDAEMLPLYRQIAAIADITQPGTGRALLLLESMLRRQGSSRELADISVRISQVFGGEPMLGAAFLTRSAETLLDLGEYQLATAHFRNALATVPLYRAAATGWLRAAILQGNWDDAGEAARCEAVAVRDAVAAAHAWHLAAVIEMDRKAAPDLSAAHKLLRAAYAHAPRNRDVGVRLMAILAAQGDDDKRAAFWAEHVAHEQNPAMVATLHRELARHHDGLAQPEARLQATAHWEALRAIAPNDLEALRRLTDIYWAGEQLDDCAKILAVRVRVEVEPHTRAQLFRRLGELYTTARPDAVLALRAWREALVFAPSDVHVLEQIAVAAQAAGDPSIGLAACERWLKASPSPLMQARCLRYMGQLLLAAGDPKRAERALVAALDRNPTDAEALAALVGYFDQRGDAGAAKVRLDRVAHALRNLALTQPTVAGLLALARVHQAREGVGAEGAWLEAAFARQLVGYFEGGDAAPVEDTSVGLVPELLPTLFPQGMSGELRHIFSASGDRLAKHIGTDLRVFGVSRGDRLTSQDPAAQRLGDAAERGGFAEVDIYVSDTLPLACIPVLTSPLVLIVGRQLLSQPRQLRAAAAAALFLAQTKLALAMTLAPEPFSQLLASLLHVFQDVVVGGHEARAIERESQKLRRLLPSALLAELRPFGLAIDPSICAGTGFRDQALVAAYRAALLACGDLGAVVDVMLGGRPADPLTALANPAVREVVRFALSDDVAQFGAAIGRATKMTIPPPLVG
ncbi:MAG: hypothetical protein IPL79_06005 [Myxococcales bacterium]|nr:hypothetical protein [Myxococcales bacterium]